MAHVLRGIGHVPVVNRPRVRGQPRTYNHGPLIGGFTFKWRRHGHCRGACLKEMKDLKI